MRLLSGLALVAAYFSTIAAQKVGFWLEKYGEAMERARHDSWPH